MPLWQQSTQRKIKDLEQEAVCYFFTDGSKMCNQEFVASCVTATGEIRHRYRTTKFASVFTGEAMAVLKTLEIISESQGESFYIRSDSSSVLMCLNERSLTKKHSILILKIKRKTNGIEETQKVY
jgi:ribonuclease HI